MNYKQLADQVLNSLSNTSDEFNRHKLEELIKMVVLECADCAADSLSVHMAILERFELT